MSELFEGQVKIRPTSDPDADHVYDPSVGTSVRINLDADKGDIEAGGFGRDGDLWLRNATNKKTIHIDAQQANMWLGGNGSDGDLLLFSRDSDGTDWRSAAIHLDGDAGDIKLRNADCAEDFATAPEQLIEAGDVLVIGDDARLVKSDRPYDRRVAGIVSGAGTKPGIVLGRLPNGRGRLPIALMGRVFCKVDADADPVRVGDLLTTAQTPGHAMRASDPMQAFGSVIGKALGSLETGRGLIPVLVALQ